LSKRRKRVAPASGSGPLALVWGRQNAPVTGARRRREERSLLGDRLAQRVALALDRIVFRSSKIGFLLAASGRSLRPPASILSFLAVGLDLACQIEISARLRSRQTPIVRRRRPAIEIQIPLCLDALPPLEDFFRRGALRWDDGVIDPAEGAGFAERMNPFRVLGVPGTLLGAGERPIIVGLNRINPNRRLLGQLEEKGGRCVG